MTDRSTFGPRPALLRLWLEVFLLLIITQSGEPKVLALGGDQLQIAAQVGGSAHDLHSVG